MDSLEERERIENTIKELREIPYSNKKFVWGLIIAACMVITPAAVLYTTDTQPHDVIKEVRSLKEDVNKLQKDMEQLKLLLQQNKSGQDE